MQDFRSLQVWATGHQLTLAVYRAKASFPREELYGLTSQIRRSCASIPANCRRLWQNWQGRVGPLSPSLMGSASELEYHLLLAHDLGFLRDAEYLPLQARAVGLKRMPSSLIVSLRKRSLPIREKVAD